MQAMERRSNGASKTYHLSAARRFRQPSGFSLAELMIALAVLGIGLLFIAAALPVGIAYTRDSVDIETGQAAGEVALQMVENNVRRSRQLAPLTPLVNLPPRNPAEQVPLTSTVAGYPQNTESRRRSESLFRPRMIPPTAIANFWNFPSNGEPCEGNFEHPYNDNDPQTGPPPSPLITGQNWKPDSRSFGYEPFIKVRPLTMGNLSGRKTGPNAPRRLVVDDGEFIIREYLSRSELLPPSPPGGQSLLEVDDATYLDAGTAPPLSLQKNLPFSPLERFFPMITPNKPFRAEQYVSGQAGVYYNKYRFRVDGGIIDDTNATTLDGYYSTELDKALDRRIGWTVFYRRLAYDDIKPGPASGYDGPRRPRPGNANPPVFLGDDVVTPADPSLYELIVVVTRRPSANHRFAVQKPDRNRDFDEPYAQLDPDDSQQGTPLGVLAPSPWLVTLDRDVRPSSPDYFMQGLERYTQTAWPPPRADQFLDNPGTSLGWQRPLSPSFPQRSTIRFRVKSAVARLLAPGSVMIPAVNDNYPRNRTAAMGPLNIAAPANRIAGFVPHMPDSLPIYEVLEVIPDDPGAGGQRGAIVVVKSNGAYPWVLKAQEDRNQAVDYFPFWIIPPSFAETRPRGGTPDVDRQPVYDRRSPIIGVYRKVVRIPEVN